MTLLKSCNRAKQGLLMPKTILTLKEHTTLTDARKAGLNQVEISLDLSRTTTMAAIGPQSWSVGEQSYPYLENCKENAVFFWNGRAFELASRFTKSLIKLVPTEWGKPTFHIDGIKMLVTARICPYEDARRKVALIEPQGKTILDTCGGLGYFAHWCLEGKARKIVSFEVNPDVVWLRDINPWSPTVGDPLSLTLGDISKEIFALAPSSFDAILHDPPRFGIAGDLYSQVFYDELARVLKTGGRLFHYVGSPNALSQGRDVPKEVSKRLVKAGFKVEVVGDGLLAQKISGASSVRARPKQNF